MSSGPDETVSLSERTSESQAPSGSGPPSEDQKATGGLAPPPVEEIPRGTAIGRYLVVHRIGQGGMGVVYAAYDAELDRKVALKLLRPRAAGGSTGHSRLLREAQAMAKVSHPNVIAIHDVGSFRDQVFMAMDLVEGSTLSRWVKDKDPTWQEVARALLDAGRGLAAAHAAGLVHRDFKPQNVLVGADGRVFVTDFGLARMADTSDQETDPERSEERELERHSRLATDLTGAGVVLGTPRYMAPEQHLGAAVDARADQFSFCASLYWALWRAFPFDPKELAQHAKQWHSRSTGEATAPLRTSSRGTSLPLPIAEPPSQPRVPARLRRAVMRGLSLDPQQRFPGMNALLAEISAALHPPSMQLALAMAALAGLLFVGGGAWLYRDRTRSQLCSGGAAEIGAVWNADISRTVQTAFATASPERGAAQSRTLAATLDSYAARWAQAYRDACEATRLRGEQTDAILSLRMTCLERRRKELSALVRLLERPDATLVDRAVDTAQSLSAIGQCGDADALGAQVGRPEDPARRAALEKLEDQLAKVEVLRLSGRYTQGLEDARAAVTVAQGLAFKPLEAQAHLELATCMDLTGDARSAVGELQKALKLAEAGRDDVTKLRVANRLTFVVGYRDLQREQGLTWSHLAEGTLERLGAEQYPELESEMYVVRGAVQVRAGDFRAAIPAFQRALAAMEHSPAGADIVRARALANIAASRGRLGEREEAVKSGRMAVAAFERLRGTDHPVLVEPLQNLANTLLELGRLDEALAAADRALQLAESKLGREHSTTGDVLDARAGVLLEMGRAREALADAERALAIHRQVEAADEAAGYSLDAIGRSKLALGQVPEALVALERAAALKPADDTVMADIRFGLARALAASRKDPERARALANEARTAFQSLKYERRLGQVDAWLASQGGGGR